MRSNDIVNNVFFKKNYSIIINQPALRETQSLKAPNKFKIRISEKSHFWQGNENSNKSRRFHVLKLPWNPKDGNAHANDPLF